MIGVRTPASCDVDEYMPTTPSGIRVRQSPWPPLCVFLDGWVHVAVIAVGPPNRVSLGKMTETKNTISYSTHRLQSCRPEGRATPFQRAQLGPNYPLRSRVSSLTRQMKGDGQRKGDHRI